MQNASRKSIFLGPTATTWVNKRLLEKLLLKYHLKLFLVDQVKIKQFSDLTGYLESKRPNDVVNVVLFRNGKEKQLKVTLAKSTATQFMGMNLRNLSPEDQKNFGIDKGVIVDAAGPYFQDQIEAGSLITGINGERIYNIDDLQEYDIRSVEWISYITPNGEQIRLRM